jgi:hypothetical protein
MSTIRRGVLALLMLLTATAIPIFAQEPVRERLNFTINVPYHLRSSDTVLPAGKYVLSQVDESDPDLFALYQGDTRHTPLALITAIPTYNPAEKDPAKTQMLIDADEAGPNTTPTIEGWVIPGVDDWEIIGVVMSHKGVASQPPNTSPSE